MKSDYLPASIYIRRPKILRQKKLQVCNFKFIVLFGSQAHKKRWMTLPLSLIFVWRNGEIPRLEKRNIFSKRKMISKRMFREREATPLQNFSVGVAHFTCIWLIVGGLCAPTPPPKKRLGKSDVSIRRFLENASPAHPKVQKLDPWGWK